MRKSLIHSILLLPMLLLALVGCRPRGVLSSREMRSVLTDLHRAEAVLQVAGYNHGHDEALAKYYQSVLDEHGITQAQFDSSLVWYTNNPQIFDKIYPRVIANLEQERDAWLAEHDLSKPDEEPAAVALSATDSLLLLPGGRHAVYLNALHAIGYPRYHSAQAIFLPAPCWYAPAVYEAVEDLQTWYTPAPDPIYPPYRTPYPWEQRIGADSVVCDSLFYDMRFALCLPKDSVAE